jgi:hypothetical protein
VFVTGSLGSYRPHAVLYDLALSVPVQRRIEALLVANACCNVLHVLR